MRLISMVKFALKIVNPNLLGGTGQNMHSLVGFYTNMKQIRFAAQNVY
jgi:hypothetical protein